MRIGLLVPEYPPESIGGGGVVFSSLHRAYVDLQHDVRVIAGSWSREILPDREVIRIPLISPGANRHYLRSVTPPSPSGVGILRNAILDLDVVHAHGFGFPMIDLGIRMAYRHHVPVVHTLHGHPVSHEWRGIVLQAAFQSYRIFSGQPALRRGVNHTSVSRAVEQLFEERYSVTSEVIGNGVSLPPLSPWPEFESIRNQTNFVVVGIGRLEHIKGFDVLIRSFAKFVRYYPQSSLVIVGSDYGEGNRLQKLAKELDVYSRVHFMGVQDRARVGTALTGADCCVISSRTEADPGVPLEAMLVGCPVIAGNLDGMSAYAIDRANVLQFSVGDSESLYQRLVELASNRSLAQTLIDGGHSVALSRKWPDVAKRYLQLLERAVSLKSYRYE